MVHIKEAYIGGGTSQELFWAAKIAEETSIEEIFEHLPRDRKVLPVTGWFPFHAETGEITLVDNSGKYARKGKTELGRKIGDLTPEGGVVPQFSSLESLLEGVSIQPSESELSSLREPTLNDCYGITLPKEAVEELGGAATRDSRNAILSRLNHLPGLEGEFSFGGKAKRTLFLNGRPLLSAKGKGQNVEICLEYGLYHSATYETLDAIEGTFSIGENYGVGKGLTAVFNPWIPMRKKDMYAPLSSELSSGPQLFASSPVPLIVKLSELGRKEAPVYRAQKNGPKEVRKPTYTTVTTLLPAWNMAGKGRSLPYALGIEDREEVSIDSIGSLFEEMTRRYENSLS